MPRPALKHDSRPPSEEKERAQVTFQEPQASAHDPDAPTPQPAPAPQPPPQGTPAGSGAPASAGQGPPSFPGPTPAQPHADQHLQTPAGDGPHQPVQLGARSGAQPSPRPSGQHAQQEARPRQGPMARYSQEHSWTLQMGKQESLPSPFVSADLDRFDLPPHPESGHPPTVPESASEPASSRSGPQPGPVHASEALPTLASGPPGGDSTAEAGKTPEQVSAEAAARQRQHPAQPAAQAEHGWEFGSFAPKPKKTHRGGHSRSQSRDHPCDVEQGRPGSSRDASEAEGQQVAREHLPQLAPEIGSPAISGFPLGPRGMVPWLARRKDSVPGSSLPQRSMVLWKDGDDDDVQLPR